MILVNILVYIVAGGDFLCFGYNREKWGVELQLQNIFSSRYEMSVENLSHLAPYNQMVWSKNLCKVFGIDFHFNLNFLNLALR